jgi:hypothetical protein
MTKIIGYKFRREKNKKMIVACLRIIEGFCFDNDYLYDKNPLQYSNIKFLSKKGGLDEKVVKHLSQIKLLDVFYEPILE